MAETTKPIEMTAPSDSWLRLMEKCQGGISIGELTVLIGGPNTGKSRMAEYMAEQLKKKMENEDGVR